MSAGGSTVVIAAMSQFPEDSGVQGFCSGALANLAHNDRACCVCGCRVFSSVQLRKSPTHAMFLVHSKHVCFDREARGCGRGLDCS